MATRSQPYELDDILPLVHMAFGQGTVTMFATPSAARLARAAYKTILKAEEWDQNALAVLEFARAVGRVSAHLANHQGATVIGTKHLKEAFRLVRHGQMRPVMCPFCPSIDPEGDDYPPMLGGGLE
jgi:hypothetical protein